MEKTGHRAIILLLEKSDFWNDLRYGLELLSHRVIKVNGCYAGRPGTFSAMPTGAVS